MHKQSREGFTLIELSLSIAFIAVLSLAVALIITNSISAYHRGLVLNQINTTGMELTDDMRAAVQNAMVVVPESLCDTTFIDSTEKGKLETCKNGGGQILVAEKRTANVWIDKNRDGSKQNAPVAGVFCTGNYSYIWNSGYYFSEDSKIEDSAKNPTELKYKNANGSTITAGDIKLLKVRDEKRSVCAAYTKSSTIDISDTNKYDIVTEDPVELLESNNNLAIYDLYAPTPAVNAATSNIYYSVSFVLGTVQGGANVMKQGSYCATPEGDDNAAIENFDYCAINKFNFAAEATGGGE